MPSFYLQPALTPQPYGFGQCFVFLFQNSVGQRVMRVIVKHGYCLLQNNRTAVGAFIYKMHSAAGNFNAVIKCLALPVKSRKTRQKRRVDINDFMVPVPYKFRA